MELQWLPLVGQVGIGLAMLSALFWALKSGNLWTDNAVRKLEKAYQTQIDMMTKYQERLEKRNDTIDERNDLLARSVGPALESARATGMVQALPQPAAERIVQQ